MLAGVACCIAMAMSQVHVVAYCTDLGYGPFAWNLLNMAIAAWLLLRLPRRRMARFA